jgi:hypothetical protein
MYCDSIITVFHFDHFVLALPGRRMIPLGIKQLPGSATALVVYKCHWFMKHFKKVDEIRCTSTCQLLVIVAQ